MHKSLEAFTAAHQDFNENKLEVVMRILSNYTPKCIVRASVSCPVSDLASEGTTGEDFARKFNVLLISPTRSLTALRRTTRVS